jgi:hypothetical protein
MADDASTPAGKPRTWSEAYDAQGELSPEEREQLGGPPAARPSPLEEAAAANPDGPVDPDAIPAWVELPADLRIPKGRRIQAIRIRAAWTDAPDKGDRVAIMWSLSVAEEKLAWQRSKGSSQQLYAEMAMQTIHAIDGVRVDWSGRVGPGNIQRFWEEIGYRGRQRVIEVFHRTHSLSPEETADFLLNCFVSRSAVAG